MRKQHEDSSWVNTCLGAIARLCACLVVVLSTSQAAYSIEAWHVSLDFIDSPLAAPPAFLTDFDPFPLTSPGNYFVTQGGLTGWTEQQARRAVALAVDDAFRAIDVGDPARRARITIHLGQISPHFVEQRLNYVLAQPEGISLALLGQARQGVYNDSDANDTIVAVSYLNEIDALGSSFLTYDTAAGVVNSIAGVTAHEIGHVFDAFHVTTSAAVPDPLPLMATEITGLPTDARLRERRFSTNEPSGTSNAELIHQNVGNAALGDLNLDNLVDGLDVGIMFGNWGQTDRLYAEGDVTGDHLVDEADFALLSENWSALSLPVHSVPEPSSVALVASSFFCILILRRRRNENRLFRLV